MPSVEPVISYPPELPVSAMRDELARVIDIVDHGASYQRQRSVYEHTGDMRAVVASVVSELD